MTSSDIVLLFGPLIVALPVFLRMFFDRSDKREAAAVLAKAADAAAKAAAAVDDAKRFTELVRHAVEEAALHQRTAMAAQSGVISQIETLVNSSSTVAAETIAGQAALIARLLPDDIAAQETWHRAVRALEDNKKAQAVAAQSKRNTEDAALAKAALDEDVVRATLVTRTRAESATVLPDETPVVLPAGTSVVPPTPRTEPGSTA